MSRSLSTQQPTITWRMYSYYLLIGLSASSSLLVIYYWILRRSSSLGFLLFHNSSSYMVWYFILTAGTIIFFGLNTVLFLYQWRTYGRVHLQQFGSSGSGALVGMFASICPICGTTLLTGVGLLGSLSVLPLQGLEIKALALGIVLTSTYWSLKKVYRNRCTSLQCPQPRGRTITVMDRIGVLVLLLLLLVLGSAGWTLSKTDPFFSRDPSLQSLLYQCQSNFRHL